MKRILLLVGLIILGNSINAQTDLEEITETINNYIKGTSNGQQKLIEKAFHPNLNLYSIDANDRLKVWFGKDYISRVVEGKKSGRIGRIVSIDFEKDIAIAKAEIVIPDKMIFIDYLMLLKVQGQWKIIHKSYTIKEFPLAKH